MERIKTYWPDVLVVVLFAVISFAYFFPADLDGRILYRHDASAGRGAGQEVSEYHERTGKVSRWTNATFSGMPTYQTAPSYQSTGVLNQVMKAYHLWLPENVWYVFAYLLGFYMPLISAGIWLHWVPSCGPSRRISSSSLPRVTFGKLWRWLICRH